MPKLEAEPRLQGLPASLVDWARTVVRNFNPIADITARLSAANAATFSALEINGPAPLGGVDLRLIKQGDGSAQISSYRGTTAFPRWVMQLGNGTVEAGANAGSDFAVLRHSDAGALLSTPFYIIRSTGNAQFSHALGVTGSITAGGNIQAGGYLFSGGPVYVHPGHGVQYSPASTTGGADYFCMGIYGDPAVGSVSWHQIYHLPGVWSGHRFLSQGTAVFEMRGNATGYSAGGWVATSDQRVKTDMHPVEDALAKLATLRAYDYERTDMKQMDGTPIRQVGLIAQDVQAVLPLAVLQDPPTEAQPDPIRSLKYDSVTALLVNGINELAAQVATLRAELESLKGAANG